VSLARLIITAVVAQGTRAAEVAATYNVARSWVYELVARYRAEGEAAFEPRSRRPHRNPRVTPSATEKLILQIRSELIEVERNGGARSTYTLAELLDAVIDHLEALGREPTTRCTVTGRWRLASSYASARCRCASCGRATSTASTASSREADHHRRVCGGTTPSCTAALPKACAGIGWATTSPLVRHRRPSPRRRLDVPTADAVVALIEAAERSRQPELAVAFRLLAALGGRRGELCEQWRDLDLTTGVCAIRRAVKQVPGGLVVGDAKNHQQGVMQLDTPTVDVLKRHRQAMEERAAVCRTELVPNAFVLSDDPDGAAPWKPNRLTQALRRLRDRAGYTGRLHDLRHWHASQLLGAGEAP
jgi:integrase